MCRLRPVARWTYVSVSGSPDHTRGALTDLPCSVMFSMMPVADLTVTVLETDGANFETPDDRKQSATDALILLLFH